MGAGKRAVARSNQPLDFTVVAKLHMSARSILTTVIFSLAVVASTPAQELRDRELKPAFDLATIEMPAQLVSIKINGTEVAPGQKIKGELHAKHAPAARVQDSLGFCHPQISAAP